MRKKTYSALTRMTALLLVLVCMLGLLPSTALAANPSTIKMDDCAYSGTKYDSPALGECYMHQMHFNYDGKSTMGFCAEKGKGMGWSLKGHTWGNPQPISDPTVKTMMAYFYAHSTGVFTDQAKALGVDDVWNSDYTWTMNSWTQAIVWRYKAGLLSDPVTACAEELLCVYNNLEHTNYSSIDDKMDGKSFRDRAQYILDLGAQGVWGECEVYEYAYTGPGSSYHPSNDVQAVMVGKLDITHEEYTLTVKKVDSTNPNKGLSGARFLVASENGAYSKEVVTGADGTATLYPLVAGTYAVTELEAPAGYEIDNAGPQYVVLPSNGSTTVTVTFTDTPEITGEGSIRKVDADDPTKGLAGAVIKITGVDNDFTGTYVTGAGGYLTDVPWKDMPLGSYTAEEITPPEGYSLSPDVSKTKQTFVWDGKTDVALVFENDAKVKIRLIKSLSQNGSNCGIMPKGDENERKKSYQSWTISDEFWEAIKGEIPKKERDPAKEYKNAPGQGRKPMPARKALEGIFYVLRTGCQWKALPREYGSGSTVHRRFQEWLAAGFFEKIWSKGLEQYDELEGIGWEWQSLDGCMVKAPLALESVGKNPTDRGKNGDKTQCSGG